MNEPPRASTSPEELADDISRRLRNVIVGALHIEKRPDDLDGKDLITELGLTSIDALEILVSVEIEFGIEVADEDLNQALIASLERLEAYVSEKLPNAAR